MRHRHESSAERRWRLFLWLCAALGGETVDWPSDPADTRVLIAMASAHHITTNLAVAIEGVGSLPDPVRDYFRAAALLNRERNVQILTAIGAAADCLARNEIPAVFLKGAAHLADGLYPDLACRLLGDVDVLVPRAAAPAAIKALATTGFDDIDPITRRWVPLRTHDSPMQRHRDSGVGIEVHQEMIYIAHAKLLPGDAVIRSAVRSRLHPDIMVPEAAHRAVHAILHDQFLHHWRRRVCGLKTLCDVSRLVALPGVHDRVVASTRHFPRYARRMIDQVLALTGLIGSSVESATFDSARARLRWGMLHPVLTVPDQIAGYLSGLRTQPLAALNLLDLSRLPERIARLRN